MGVGLIGLGTVGSAVARRLVEEWELLTERAGVTPVLRRVAVRDATRRRSVDLRNARLDEDPQGLVDDPDVEVVVEVMGGVPLATDLMLRALRAGKPVVTANKLALAINGGRLASAAREAGRSLRWEAAAGGGLPVVALLRESLRGDRIHLLEAVINGTTNVILSAMTAGATFDSALADAQRRGYAEADPASDVEGEDAAAKLVLLSRLAFDDAAVLQDVATTGIAGLSADDLLAVAAAGGRLRLVARAVRAEGFLHLAVRPTAVLAGHPLHEVDGADNGLVIRSDLAGTVVLSGLGAGGESTASAVVSDIVATVRQPQSPPPLPERRLARGDGEQLESRGLLRVGLSGVDEAEALVVQALEDRGVVVATVAVLSGSHGPMLAITTEPVPRGQLVRAAETLDSLAAVSDVGPVLDVLGP